MTTRLCLFALVAALLLVGVAGAQYPILDLIANKLIHKYQQSN